MLGVVEASLDDVAAAVVDFVVADRSAAAVAAPFPVAGLVRRFRDDGDDAALAQIGADRA